MTKLEEIRRLINDYKEDLGTGFVLYTDELIKDIEEILDTRCGIHGIILDYANECGLCKLGKYE